MMTAVEADVWERRDVSDWSVVGVEQTGSTRNHWLADPATGDEWLHKDTVIPANGLEQGEDWAEVVATQIAKLLGVPCAETRLCSREDRRGSLSLTVRAEGESLNDGMVALVDAEVPGYFPHTEEEPGIDPDRSGVRRPGHSLANIRKALNRVAAPPGFDGPETLTGFDVFAGYMVLDALIANRDRHEENWAVLTPQLRPAPERLAPSYDHASSLGFNVPDPKRQARLQQPSSMMKFAEGGTAWRFEHKGRPPTLVAHAAKAVAMSSPEGADWWQDRLAVLGLEPVLAALSEGIVPGMSEPAAMFAHALLDLNLRRLRDALGQRA